MDVNLVHNVCWIFTRDRVIIRTYSLDLDIVKKIRYRYTLPVKGLNASPVATQAFGHITLFKSLFVIIDG